MRRVFIVVAVATLVAAVWALSDILLLLFGAVLFAVMLHAIGAPLQAGFGLRPIPALALAGSSLLVLLVVAAFYLGPELASELRNVARAPASWGDMGFGTSGDAGAQ